MSDDLIFSLLRCAIWATALVVSVGILSPTLSYWVRKSLANREQELKAERDAGKRRATGEAPRRAALRS